MKFKNLLINNWTLFIYFVLAIPAILPFLHAGFFQFHDDVQVARIYEMGKSLSVFIFPVRWVPDLGYGLGYPLFNFYSVLPYYLGGMLSLLGIDALLATKVVFILAIVGSGLSMYLFARSFFGQTPALAAAVLYLYFPYHAVNIFVRGDLAEFTAYAFLPIFFLSLFKVHLSEKFEKKDIVFGSLSLAAIILSHNLTAFMLFVFSGLFIIYSLIISKDKKRILVSFFVMFGVAFLLSAFYAIPASIESKYTNIATILGGGSNPLDHFICVNQLWNSNWGYGGSVAGCIDGLSFKLGKLNVIFCVLALLLLLLNFRSLNEKRGIVVLSVVFLFMSIFMTLSYSSILWSLPFMEYLQFPWRFLNFTGLFLSFVVAGGIWSLSLWLKKAHIFILVGLIVVLGIIATSYKLFQPERFLNRNVNYYTNHEYLTWTASKISDEYLPSGFVKPKNKSDVKRGIVNLNRENELFAFDYNKNKFVSSINGKQSALQIISDSLSIIGVFALIAVIMFKTKRYGKKAS